jgi:hypothetical protein
VGSEFFRGVPRGAEDITISTSQIRAACQGAGFIQGAAREGIGLQIHCIMPIMQARAQPLTARKPLPKVNPQLVRDCRARNARFGRPPLSPSQALAQPLPASPSSGFAYPSGNPSPAYGGRGQAVPYPGQDNALRPPNPVAPDQQEGISALRVPWAPPSQSIGRRPGSASCQLGPPSWLAAPPRYRRRAATLTCRACPPLPATHAGATGEGVRAIGASNPQLGCAGRS